MNCILCLGWLRWKIESGVLKSDIDTPRFLDHYNFLVTVSVLISERHFGVVRNRNFDVRPESTSCDLRPGRLISEFALLIDEMEVTLLTCRAVRG